jgi:hypothetical protein
MVSRIIRFSSISSPYSVYDPYLFAIISTSVFVSVFVPRFYKSISIIEEKYDTRQSIRFAPYEYGFSYSRLTKRP